MKTEYRQDNKDVQQVIVQEVQPNEIPDAGSHFIWWQMIFLPIIIAVIGVIPVVINAYIKVKEINKKKNESPDPNEWGDETTLNYLIDKVKGKKDE